MFVCVNSEWLTTISDKRLNTVFFANVKWRASSQQYEVLMTWEYKAWHAKLEFKVYWSTIVYKIKRLDIIE